MRNECSKCRSTNIIPDVQLQDRGDYNATRPAEVCVYASPDAWVMKGAVKGQVKLSICGDCGHAELKVTNHAELFEAYQRSGVNSPDPG